MVVYFEKFSRRRNKIICKNQRYLRYINYRKKLNCDFCKYKDIGENDVFELGRIYRGIEVFKYDLDLGVFNRESRFLKMSQIIFGGDEVIEKISLVEVK